MNFNPTTNLLHFFHYKLTLIQFRKLHLYIFAELISRMMIGILLFTIISFFLFWLKNNFELDFFHILFFFQLKDHKVSFVIAYYSYFLFFTLLLFRPVKFKTFWKIHKSITKSKVYYYQLRRKFILQFLGIVIIFFVIRALLKFYYPN
jgi:hypothetical protein